MPEILLGYNRWNMPIRVTKTVGMVGVLACVIIFALKPSFPTPDKLLVFLTLLFMCFGQAVEMLKRFAPFVAIILVYESFRGIADGLNSKVNFMFMVDADRWFFGGTLPTTTIQQWLWNGQVQWYDFALYLAYMMHFVFPLALAIVIWKKFPKQYWKYVTSFSLLMFGGFLTYLIFPAAPPWMASDMKLIEPISRISSDVWFALGVNDFPSLYNKIAPNPVAAVPSLHAAFSTLFAIFVISLFKSKWRFVVLIYPAMIYFGTIYQGEHYAVDALLGALYAVAAFAVAPHVERLVRHLASEVHRRTADSYAKIRPINN